MTLGAIAKRYAFFARVEIGRLLYLLGPYFLVMGLLIVGIAVCVRRNISLLMRKVQLADAWPFILASWLLFLPLLHVEDRYMLPVLPAFLVSLVMIMLTLQKLVESKLPERYSRMAVGAPVSLVPAFLSAFCFWPIGSPPRQPPPCVSP